MDKNKINSYISDYLLNNALSIFKYDGLPENVKAVDLEKNLLRFGKILFTKWHDEFYIFSYSDTGKQNYLGEYTNYQVNNPYIQCNEVFSDDNAVRIFNTDTHEPLINLMGMYSELLTESYITLNMADINSRIPFFISARDNATKASAEIFVKQILDGKQGVIAEQPLFESLKINPLTDHENISQIVELNKFFYSDYFQKIGLTNLYNNVHDRISATETEFTATSIYPYVDNMKRNRDIAVEKINSMFGLNVSVEFSSSWDYRIKNGENLTEKDFKDSDLGFGGTDDKNSDSENFENDPVDTETDSESKEDKKE
mgnify:FL=1